MSGATIDAEVDVTDGNPIRSGSTAVTFHKTGLGTLAFGGTSGTPSVAGSVMIIDQGAVKMNSATALGGGPSSSAVTDFNLVINSGAKLLADFSGDRTGGAITLNSATLQRDDGFTGETNFDAAGATDVITINGNSTMINKEIALTNTAGQFDPFMPIVVNKGAVFTMESDNTGGFDGNVGIDVRGPTDLRTTGNPYITFTIQGGATVQQLGVGRGSLRPGCQPGNRHHRSGQRQRR